MCNHTDTQRESACVLLVDDHHGIYSGQVFAERQPALYNGGALMASTLETLLAGPDQEEPELYDEACNELENGYIRCDDGSKLHPQWMDGGLFGIEAGAEWCDECECWFMPFGTVRDYPGSDAKYARRIELAHFTDRHGNDVRLEHATEGWSPAGSMSRYNAERWSVLTRIAGADYGQRFSTKEAALERFKALRERDARDAAAWAEFNAS